MHETARKINVPLIISLVVALNGFVNLATGLAAILGISIGLRQVTDYFQMSPVLRTSGAMSVFLGLFLIFLGKGLFERRYRSWWICLVTLGVLVANNLYRGTTPQTVLLSLTLLVGLVVFRRQFNRHPTVAVGYAQIVAVAAIVFALAYGILGSYLLRDEFDGIVTLTDAVYYTVVTYSTVGYGDIGPVGEGAKVFVTSMIPVGLAAFAMALTALVGPEVERRMKGVLSIMERFQNLKGHVIVCGYSCVTATVLDELARKDVARVVIENRAELAEFLRTKGCEVVMGDPTLAETLRDAGLLNAKALICAHDRDETNVLIAITARELCDTATGARPRIIVRVEDEENIPKAKSVGADEVISPSTLGGQLIARKAFADDKHSA